MLVALSGKIGSGKSYASKILTDNYGYTFYDLAEPIKKIGLICGFEYHQLFGTQEQKEYYNSDMGMTGRQFMQLIGTEFPKLSPKFNNIWIKIMMRNKKYNKYVIDGVRTDQQCESIKELGGIVIEIKNTTESKYSSDHISERGITHPDYVIWNSSDLEQDLKFTLSSRRIYWCEKVKRITINFDFYIKYGEILLLVILAIVIITMFI
jgi:hypothetical protein